MLELRTKKELANQAHTFAMGNALVRYRNVTYVPVDYETQEVSTIPPKDRTIWLPMSRDDIRQVSAGIFGTLYGSEADLSSFEFMVTQNSTQQNDVVSSLLVRTKEGLKLLTEEGQLEDPTGDFVPNTILPLLVDDEKLKAELFDQIEEWVGSEEDARSLLHHLATALSPGWSAVKYVLLIGEGRNGKSLLMKMMQQLLGPKNVSEITRQQMAEQSPVVCELNGKLINIVFDGRAEYLKDSGTEKSLIAGESAPIRRLYESTPTMVRTNALFIEGLNREPKSNDKSSALQRRLVRFQFNNVYPLDRVFEKKMLSQKNLGVLLALLIDHYVMEDELATKLAPTAKAVELELEHLYVNSLALQFLKMYEETDGVDSLVGEPISDVARLFQSWRIRENDMSTWTEPDVIALFNPLVVTERRSQRTAEGPRKVRMVTALKPDTRAYLESLKGDSDEDRDNTVVAD